MQVEFVVQFLDYVHLIDIDHMVLSVITISNTINNPTNKAICKSGLKTQIFIICLVFFIHVNVMSFAWV